MPDMRKIIAESDEDMFAYYSPTGTMEYFDGSHFYNKSGQMLRDPQEYNKNSEGYTPFGDE